VSDITAFLNDVLLTVQRPGRYIGGEHNQKKKEWTPDRIKVCLAFPDVYEVGMSYLGLKILYGIINGRDDALAERVFSPWTDFEAALRARAMPLFSLESRKSLRDFDIVGFSLTYELSYTNVLNILDLGGIPLKGADRSDDDPLVIAGGPACFNPEPMHEFIDAFVIGEGEEVVGEIIDAYRAARRAGAHLSRRELCARLAGLEGVYVPSLYHVAYHEGGTIKECTPNSTGVPGVVKKRVVRDFENAYYPTDQIVPYLQIVHDRIVLEIMRGCPHACRFCQAGPTSRPVRARSVEKVLQLAADTYRHTGYDEVSLLSLSSGDHPQIALLITGLNARMKGRAVSVSVPSLRIEDALRGLPALISHVKKSGLTFAPEVARDCLRKVLNKNIDINLLFKAAEESFRAGWRSLKLYFMIGLPQETAQDVEEIAGLVLRVSKIKKDIDGQAAHVTASVNTFIPKPHTPFQWSAMETIDLLAAKQAVVRKALRPASKRVELDFHSLEKSRLEAVFSRGDRRLAAAILEAWKRGARFDGWDDRCDYSLWTNAFNASGIDASFYATRRRPFDEILPWDFITLGAGRAWLLQEAHAIGGDQ